MNTRARHIAEATRERVQTDALDRLAEQYESCEVHDLPDGGLAVKCYDRSPPPNVIGMAPVARYYVTPEGRRSRVG